MNPIQLSSQEDLILQGYFFRTGHLYGCALFQKSENELRFLWISELKDCLKEVQKEMDHVLRLLAWMICHKFIEDFWDD